MHSLTPGYLAKLRFDTQQLATLRALGEYGGKQRLYVAQSPEVLSDLRQIAVITGKRPTTISLKGIRTVHPVSAFARS